MPAGTRRAAAVWTTGWKCVYHLEKVDEQTDKGSLSQVKEGRGLDIHTTNNDEYALSNFAFFLLIISDDT